MWIHHILFIHSSIGGHLGCFQVGLLAIVNDAVMNMGVQISVEISPFNSFAYIPRSRIIWYLDHMVILFLVF